MKRLFLTVGLFFAMTMNATAAQFIDIGNVTINLDRVEFIRYNEKENILNIFFDGFKMPIKNIDEYEYKLIMNEIDSYNYKGK